MATTTRTRKTASAPKTEETTTPPAPEETPVENTPEDVDTDEMEDLSTLEKEMAKLPDLDNPVIKAMLPFVAEVAASIRDDREIVLMNTLTDEGVNVFAHNSDNEEIVKIREVHDDINETITRLTKEINEKTAELNDAYTDLTEKAREVMAGQLDENAKVTANIRIKQAKTKMKSYLSPIMAEVDDLNEMPALKAYLDEVKTVTGDNAIRMVSTSGDSAPPRTDHSAKVRTWAKNNGIKLNEKGRVPKWAIEQYNEANPNDQIKMSY